MYCGQNACALAGLDAEAGVSRLLAGFEGVFLGVEVVLRRLLGLVREVMGDKYGMG